MHGCAGEQRLRSAWKARGHVLGGYKFRYKFTFSDEGASLGDRSIKAKWRLLDTRGPP